jgi:hypothetical protein
MMGDFEGGQKEWRQFLTLRSAPAISRNPGSIRSLIKSRCSCGHCVDFVPYADFQLLRLPKDRAISKLKQGLAFLSDVLPTGYNGAFKFAPDCHGDAGSSKCDA